jgi:hypothetical protein
MAIIRIIDAGPGLGQGGLSIAQFGIYGEQASSVNHRWANALELLHGTGQSVAITHLPAFIYDVGLDGESVTRLIVLYAGLAGFDNRQRDFVTRDDRLSGKLHALCTSMGVTLNGQLDVRGTYTHGVNTDEDFIVGGLRYGHFLKLEVLNARSL